MAIPTATAAETTQERTQRRVYTMMGGDTGYAERLREQDRERAQYREHLRYLEAAAQQTALYETMRPGQPPSSPPIQKIRVAPKTFNELLKERIK